MSRLGEIGLYGKIAAQPDFARAGAGAFSQAGLDRWLQDGMEMLRAERTTLPAAPTAFMLAPPDSAVAFVGAFAPSADAAGRVFPLAIFAEVGAQDFASAFPAWPAEYAPFVAGAAALALAGATADATELSARAASLATAPFGSAPAWEGEAISSLRDSLGGSAGGLAYAVSTLLGAIQTTKSAPAGKSSLTLDFSAPTAALRAFWLEVIRRRLDAREGGPSVFWSDGPEGRTLVTLGPPSAGAFAYLANPRHRSNRLWPLQTTVASAIDQAMVSLAPQLRRVVDDPSATLKDLAAALA
ncbi:MAG TPA: type VI secretion system-associated protein TagF [Polyangia bacterium]|nr:type VI secretion system-associated protein TagF [Polyangia bacterium]